MSLPLLLLLFACVCASAVARPTTHHIRREQNDAFIWGTATAAYQIEGSYNVDGKLPSEWDIFSHLPGKVANGDNGDVADDAYRRIVSDIDYLRGLNVTAYRFSISWPRIIDGNNNVNPVGIAHYNTLINALLDAGIQPFVTMFHWDLPNRFSTFTGQQAFLDQNYFLPLWNTYVTALFDNFGDRVKKWITFNEPHSFCVGGYAGTGLAPGRCSDRTQCQYGDSTTEPYLCSHTVLLAHIQTVKLYRDEYEPKFGKGSIGMTIDGSWGEPYTASVADRQAAMRHVIFQIGWYADPLYFGDYPEQMKYNVGSRLPTFTADETALFQQYPPDFFGFNHYTTTYVANNPNSSAPFYGDEKTTTTEIDQYGNVIGPRAESSWLYVVPWGFPKVLEWISLRYNNPLVYVTENGCDVPNESSIPLPQVLHDPFRIAYLQQYLGNMTQNAIKSFGVNVGAYFVWSLMDNFEWSDGYTKRFGLHYVDYKNNQTRYVKDSAKFYQQWILTSDLQHPTGESVDDDKYADVREQALLEYSKGLEGKELDMFMEEQMSKQERQQQVNIQQK